GSVTRSSFSRTASAARSMRVPEPNSSVTSDWPGREIECMRVRPATTPTASSTGRVTNCSTSSGAASGRSVRMVSDGYEMSGSRSTDRREAATSPKIITPSVTMKTVTGRWSETSTSFMVEPPLLALRRLGTDRLDLRALLEAALAHGDDAVAGLHAGEDLHR